MAFLRLNFPICEVGAIIRLMAQVCSKHKASSLHNMIRPKILGVCESQFKHMVPLIGQSLINPTEEVRKIKPRPEHKVTLLVND